MDVVNADATSMPFETDRFSGAIGLTMLHHVPSAALQDRLFAEVARVLRPGASSSAPTASRPRRSGPDTMATFSSPSTPISWAAAWSRRASNSPRWRPRQPGSASPPGSP